MTKLSEYIKENNLGIKFIINGEKIIPVIPLPVLFCMLTQDKITIKDYKNIFQTTDIKIHPNTQISIYYDREDGWFSVQTQKKNLKGKDTSIAYERSKRIKFVSGKDFDIKRHEDKKDD